MTQRFSPLGRYGLLVGLVVFALDQISKHWALGTLNPQEAVAVLPFFNLVLVWNYGVSFGMFSEHGEAARWVLVGLTFTIMLGLVWWLSSVAHRYVALAVGMVLGGALGNVVDRVRLGAVTDFLDFHVAGYHWPAFNIADAAICVGVAILVWDSFFGSGRIKHS